MNPSDLIEWRMSRWLTQADLAELLGVHAMTVSTWERGSAKPAPYLILALGQLDMTNNWSPGGQTPLVASGLEF